MFPTAISATSPTKKSSNSTGFRTLVSFQDIHINMEREENRNLIEQMREAITSLQEIKERLLEENKALRARKEHLEKVVEERKAKHDALMAERDAIQAEIRKKETELAKRKRSQ